MNGLSHHIFNSMLFLPLFSLLIVSLSGAVKYQHAEVRVVAAIVPYKEGPGMQLPQHYAKIIPDKYKNCSTYGVAFRDPLVRLEVCIPDVCHTDCVCNHYGTSGFCLTIADEPVKRCQCRYLSTENALLVPPQICNQVRKSFFGKYRNSEVVGCNPICRTDCICNHGAKDGVCGDFHSMAYCRCLYYDD